NFERVSSWMSGPLGDRLHGRRHSLELDPPGRPPVAADLPRLLEAVEVVADPVGRGDPEGFADFANRRGPALVAHGPGDHVEDRLLTIGGIPDAGQALGLTRPGAPGRSGRIGLAHVH